MPKKVLTGVGAVGGFLIGGPAGAAAGAGLGATLSGAFGGGRAPTLSDPAGGTLTGLTSLTTPGLQFSRQGGAFDLSRTTDVLGQENALRARLGGLDPTGRLSGIEANRIALAGIQTRSQQLRGDVGALAQQNLDLSPFDTLRSRFGNLAAQAGAIDLGAFGELREDVSGLREDIDPDALAEAQSTILRNRRAESVGNLRESLGRRGVLGSSFAQDAIARQELEFAQGEAITIAEGRIQSALAAGQLAQLEGDILNSEISQQLAQLSLSGQLTQAEQSALRDQTSFALQEAAFKGQLFQLDAVLLEQQSRNVFISMGLTDQEAQVFSQQLSQIMSEAQILQQTTLRQLNELGIAGNIANGVQTNITNIANSNAELAIQAAKAKADALAGLAPLIEELPGLENFLSGGVFGGG